MSDAKTSSDDLPTTHPDDSPSRDQSTSVDQISTPLQGTPTPPQHPAPAAAKPKSKGGPATHKSGCGCRPCAARRRTEEAIAGRTGPDRTSPVAATEALVPPKDILSDLPAVPVSRMKQHVARWLTMKTANPDLTNKEIAQELGISLSTLQNTLYKARQQGWLTFVDPVDELKYGMIPKIADNLNLFLDARDRTVTLEAAKATLFREYASKEGINDAPPTTILALKIEMPTNAAPTTNIKGVIVGTPVSLNVVEGEVVNATQRSSEISSVPSGLSQEKRPE